MNRPGLAGRMRAIGFILLFAAAAGADGCGEDEQASSLSGSIGELRSLDFDRVEVRIFRPAAGQPHDQLQIQYVREGGGKPAVLTVDITGLSLQSGLTLDLVEALPAGGTRGIYYYTTAGGSSEHPPLERGSLTLEQWGAPGDAVSGRFFLVFLEESGRNLKGTFAAELQEEIR